MQNGTNHELFDNRHPLIHRCPPVDTLIVDDDRALARALSLLTRRLHCSVRVAHTTGDAKQQIGERCPALLITDWDLGYGSSGIDVAEYAASKNDQCRIIFYTGNSVIRLHEMTEHLAVSRYLKKPLVLYELQRQLLEVINIP